jgi:hypothetical protein
MAANSLEWLQMDYKGCEWMRMPCVWLGMDREGLLMPEMDREWLRMPGKPE